MYSSHGPLHPGGPETRQSQRKEDMQAELLQERPQALLKACRVAGGGAAGLQAPAPGSHAAEVWGSSGRELGVGVWQSSGLEELPPSCLRSDNYSPAQGQLVLFS